MIGLLLFVVLVVGFWAQGGLLRHALSGTDGITRYLIGHALELVELLVFAWAASRIERRSFGAYGLPWRSALRGRFWQGAAAGIVALALLMAVLAGLGGLRDV